MRERDAGVRGLALAALRSTRQSFDVPMPHALLGLGSNLGDRQATLDAAMQAIGRVEGVECVSHSRWQAFVPVGGPEGQDEYLNGAAVLRTDLGPGELMPLLQKVEHDFGRQRQAHWGPRTLDIDLLLYDDQVVATPDLVVPHPRLSFRRFVLVPAVEIAGDWKHPRLGTSLAELLDQLDRNADRLVLEGGDPRQRSELELELMLHFTDFARIDSPIDYPGWSDRHATWLQLVPPPVRTADQHTAPGDGERDPPELPKLAIRFTARAADRQAPLPDERPGVPTLEVEASNERQVLGDSLAAVEAVWPALGQSEDDGVE